MAQPRRSTSKLSGGPSSSSMKLQRRRLSRNSNSNAQQQQQQQQQEEEPHQRLSSRQMSDNETQQHQHQQQQQQQLQQNRRRCSLSHSKKQQQHHRCLCLPKDFTQKQLLFPSVWLELRSRRQLCDGVIRCAGEKSFPVHRLVLSAASPYFRALFTSRLGSDASSGVVSVAEEGEEEGVATKEIAVPEAEAELMERLLDYVYTGTCQVDAANVEHLLPLADRLEVLGLVKLCCQFLIGELSFDNCLGIYKFARHYFCQDLEECGRRYIRQNFKNIFRRSAEFKELACDELEQILRDDELNVRSEDIVFEALKVWVEWRSAERSRHLPRLLNCARYGLLDLQYFRDHVLTWKSAQSQECKSVLTSINSYLEKRARRNQSRQPDLKDELARPRVPHEVLFAMGGWCFKWTLNYVETYDIRADRWLGSTCRDVTPRAYHGLCVLDGLIYVIGGYDGQCYFNTVYCYDPVNGAWREKACMHHARCYVGACVLDGKIYALGGNNGLTRMSSCERYEPGANQWETISSMQKPRSDASAAALDGRIYVAGGYNGYAILDSVEIYEVASGQWSFIAPMLTIRTGHSLVAHRGSIYVIGGFDGVERLSSCEKYEPDRPGRTWQSIAEMKSRRSSFTTAILDDMIFAIGGFDDPHTLSRVEYYDTERGEWRESSPMILGRSALRACVVKGLTNARKHTFHQLENKP